MIYKINFNIVFISQQAYITITKHVDDIKEGYVTTNKKENMNVVTKILQEEKVSFTVEEINNGEKNATQTP